MGLRSRVKGLVKRALGREERPARSAPTPRPTPPPRAPEPDPYEEEEDEEDLANLECGGQELKERRDAGEELVIVDVRTLGEVRGGVIPGAIHMELNTLPQRWEELREANEVVFYCAAGIRSLQAVYFMRQQGFINATSLAGGFGAWMHAGGQMVPLDPKG